MFYYFQKTMNSPPAEIKGAEELIVDSFEQQSEFDDITAYAESIEAQYHMILESYLDEGSLKRNAEMSWATINQEVGFIEISAMIDYIQGEDADTVDEEQGDEANTEDEIQDDEAERKNEIDAVKIILNQVMSDL